MKKIVTLLLTLMLLACTTPATKENAPTEQAPMESTADVTFTLTGENFKFVMDGKDNPTLRVKQGERVRIAFTSTQGLHDWVLDEYSIATERVRDPNSTSLAFIADKAGTFEYYCSVGKHRANGMKGLFIVEAQLP